MRCLFGLGQVSLDGPESSGGQCITPQRVWTSLDLRKRPLCFDLPWGAEGCKIGRTTGAGRQDKIAAAIAPRSQSCRKPHAAALGHKVAVHHRRSGFILDLRRVLASSVWQLIPGLRLDATGVFPQHNTPCTTLAPCLATACLSLAHHAY